MSRLRRVRATEATGAPVTPPSHRQRIPTDRIATMNPSRTQIVAKPRRAHTSTQEPVAYLLVFISHACGPCLLYMRDVHKPLMEKIAKDKRIKPILMSVSLRAMRMESGPDGTPGPMLQERVVTSQPEGEVLHPEASDETRWGAWTPFFALVTAESWRDHSRALDGVVLGGERDPSGVIKPSNRGNGVQRTPDDLYRWMVKELLTDRFRKTWAPSPAPRTPPDVSWRYNGGL